MSGAFQLKIRRMMQEDIPSVRHVAEVTWHHTYKNIIPEHIRTEFLATAYSDKSLNYRMRNNVLLVVEDAGHLVGFAEFTPLQDSSEVELSAIYILPSHQGKGIGTQLLQEGIKNFPDAKVIKLRVESRNAPAKSFYLAKGFLPTREYTILIHGYSCEITEMEKHL